MKRTRSEICDFESTRVLVLCQFILNSLLIDVYGVLYNYMYIYMWKFVLTLNSVCIIMKNIPGLLGSF